MKRNICHHLTHRTPAAIVSYEACTPVTSCQTQYCGYSLCLYLMSVSATYWRQLMRIKLRRAPQRCLVALHLRQQFTPVTLKATFNSFRSCIVVSWDHFAFSSSCIHGLRLKVLYSSFSFFFFFYICKDYSAITPFIPSSFPPSPPVTLPTPPSDHKHRFSQLGQRIIRLQHTSNLNMALVEFKLSI